MSYSDKCEACSVSVHLSPEEVEKIFGKMTGVKNIKTVSEDEYKKRMDICMGCESLLFNTTCRHCGCLIQIKAKLKHAACPYPYKPKW
ncbi:MAG: DUF6171 family protein [Caldicoprobacterales bacterium]|jgi:hypothetical protein|nr:hypothetical protein [Clostridiales bacterium]